MMPRQFVLPFVLLLLAATLSEFAASAAEPEAAAAPKLIRQSKEVPLIPRSELFGNPDKAAPRMSFDGEQLSYLAPVDGVLNIWVGPIDDPAAAKPVTSDKKRGIRSYQWAYTNKHLLYIQDAEGNEDWHVYRVDLASGETKDLTPAEKVSAQIEQVSHKFPGEVLISLNERDAKFHDIYRVDIVSGERKLVQENKEYAGFLTDEDFRVRFASKFLPDGGNQLLEPDGERGWKEYLTIPMQDTMTTRPVGFDKSGDTLYLIDSRERNTGALTTVDLKSGKQTVVAKNDLADVSGIMAHPTENTIQAVSFNYERTKWDVFDDKVAQDLRYLKTVADGDITVASRTLDDSQWIVAFLMDNGPIRYYVYDRAAKKERFLFTNRKSLEDLPLVKMQPHVIEARDGMKLVSYLTLPPTDDGDAASGLTAQLRMIKPMPLVLVVHGGPWARDSWGFNPTHQLLANRGYAVLSVNFRGSTGFGKKFINAGNQEWAGKMHDDLLDAVEWAVKRGIADPKRVAIMGGSYGGYATLVGLTFTPETFACGVDIVGPSNLTTLLNTIPPYWAPALQMFKDRVGDHQTEEGRNKLDAVSPLNFVEKIKRPLLIGQGANDPRVKQSEADQIVTAMQQKKIPVTYVLFPDEGHGFARPENSLAFNAVTEAFLARHLGGRFEPVGSAFKNSRITVPTGAEQVPGLEEALEAVEQASTETPAKPVAK